MKRAPVVVASLLIALLVGTGIGKITRAKPIRHNLQASEVPRRWWSRLAVLELLGATGIVVGLFIPPIGVLAAVCVTIYLAGAVAAHIRAGDPNVLPSGAGMILSAVLVKLMVEESQDQG